MPELEFDKKYQRTLREVADKCRQHFDLNPKELIKVPEANGVCPGQMVKVAGFENKIGTAGELMNVFHHSGRRP